MSKSNFVPPKLKDKHKWSANLHSFVKMSLTKNPKRRPTAQKLLEVSQKSFYFDLRKKETISVPDPCQDKIAEPC